MSAPTRSGAVAIVGLSCRFPGASSPDELWQLLRDGRDAVTEVPANRWDSSHFYDPDTHAPGKMNTRWGGFLDRIDEFDPLFFRIAPREAPIIDPQHRLLLELAWESLEAAAIVPESLAGSASGVFIGLCNMDYGNPFLEEPTSINSFCATGTLMSTAAGRLSYTFNLRGPSLVVDTACSSSLVAVHLACQSLLSGESTLALAGGANLLLEPERTVTFTKAGITSPDGRCKAFDARANGYVRGEGAGLVVLKALDQAIHDGDPIWAVIRGSAINQDGLSNGLAAPNRSAQELVLRSACRSAGVSPGDLQYLEAHGTGTLLGDSIEAAALGAVVGAERPASDPLLLGTIKSNIGHLEGAAGIAGLIKTTLMLKHREIPPSLHFETPNPHIPFDDLRLRVVDQLRPWPTGDNGRAATALAGVSSFGISGTNSHVLLEAAPPAHPDQDGPATRPTHLFPLSAHSVEALGAAARRHARFLDDHPSADLADLCRTAALGRTHFRHRLGLVAGSTAELRGRLDTIVADGVEATLEEIVPDASSRSPQVAFLFTGQGAQAVDMGRQLFDTVPEFRATIERCHERLAEHGFGSLLDVLAGRPSPREIDRTAWTQPALVALECALAERWRAWGVTPAYVLGHSVGELAALATAGALGVEDAVLLAAERGRLMQALPENGLMAAAFADEATVAAAIEPFAAEVAIAAVNGPDNVVLSGAAAAVRQGLARLAEVGVKARLLKVSHAFHSPLMQPMVEDYRRAVEEAELRSPELPIIANVTAEPLAIEDYAAYAGRHVLETVRFQDGVTHLTELGCDVFLEIGPTPILTPMVQRLLSGAATCVATLRRGRGDWKCMHEALATLYARGVDPDWRALYGERRGGAPLPTYPFERRRYWHSLEPRSRRRGSDGGDDTLHRISRTSPEFLDDHVVHGTAVMPGASWLEMAWSAAADDGPSAFALTDVAFEQPLHLPQQGSRLVRVRLDNSGGFRIDSASDDGSDLDEGSWMLHATGRCAAADRPDAAPSLNLNAVRERCTDRVGADRLYASLAARGLAYGPRLRGVQELWRRPGEALAAISLDLPAAELARYAFHPALLDSCLHPIAAAVGDEMGGTFLPAEVASMQWHGRPAGPLWSHARVRSQEPNPEEIIADVLVFDHGGRPLVDLEGLRLVRLGTSVESLRSLGKLLYEVAWQPDEQPADAATEAEERLNWLVLANGRGVAADLLTRLEARGQEYIAVARGEGLCRLGANRFEIAADSAQEFRDLFATLRAEGRRMDRILHLWSLGDEPEDPRVPDEEPCLGLLHLVQALVDDGQDSPPPLCIVTRGACSAGSTADEPAGNPGGSALWGLGRVVVAEHPKLASALVDLPPRPEPADYDALLAHCFAANGEAAQVALRAGRRYTPHLALAAVPPRPGRPFAAGACLITGGLGDLGLEVARHLVARGIRRVILLGRTPMPPRGAWRELPAGSRNAQRAQRIRKLEALGAAVHLAAVDIGEASELAAFLDQYETEGWPPIRGVVHAAGVLRDGVVSQMDAEQFRSAWRPKARGAWLLHSAFEDQPLDFFVLFSSVAGTLGSPGQGNYAAANAFLDGLARYRRARGLPALAVAWGPWRHLGLARQDLRAGQYGVETLGPRQCLDALDRLMAAGVTEAVVTALDPERFVEARPAARAFLGELLNENGEHAATGAPDLDRAALLALSGDELDERLGDELQRLVGRLLAVGSEQLPLDRPLNRMGLDSLIALELKNGIQAGTGVEVPMEELISGPSVAELLDIVRHRLPQSATDVAGDPLQLSPDPDRRHQPFPLNEIQQAYWIGRTDAFEMGRVSTHFYGEFDSPGLDVARLERAWQRLIERHDMLRAVILEDGQQQVLETAPAYTIEVDDLRGLPAEGAAEHLDRVRARMSHQVLPGTEWPLFELRAHQLDDRVRFHLSLDLLIADVGSILILCRELTQLYHQPDTVLDPLDLSFRDYVLSEIAHRDSPSYQRALEFWRERIAALPPAPELPLAKRPALVDKPVFVRRTTELEPDTWKRLQGRAADLGLTSSVVLATAYAHILATWCKSPRFTLNATLFNRLPLHQDIHKIVGDFTSMVLLGVDLSEPADFVTRARALQRQLGSALDHRQVSGVEVLREMARVSGRDAGAVMPVVFTSALSDVELDWLGEMVYAVSQTPQVWLDHQVYERSGHLVLNWDAVEELFPTALLDTMFAAYRELLVRLADEDRLWTAVPRLLPADQADRRAAVNATEVPLSQATLHGLFLERVAEYANEPAVIAVDRTLSYAELEARSRHLAGELRRRGATRNRLIAVVMEKGWEQIVAVLAVLRAGAAYLPVDPSFPRDRQHQILAAGEARIALTQTALVGLEWPADVSVLAVGTDAVGTDAVGTDAVGTDAVGTEPAAAGAAAGPENRVDEAEVEDIAYVIFTSGSTGQPKGVVIDHRGAVNTILDVNRRFGIGRGDRALALSALNFDLSVHDIFGLLAAGGAVVMPAPGSGRDPAHWLELLARQRVTVWNSVPALMQLLIEYADAMDEPLPETLELAMYSGDWIPVNLPDRVRARCPGVRQISLGGATEASIWSIFHPIGQVETTAASIPYGKPLANQTFHVYDENFAPRPDWVPGRLFIGGVGVALGYWRDEARTAERFVVHPETGERLYHTGDLGRYLPNGVIEFLGREDFQVKIRGHRIELGEIEATLTQHPGVRDAVVVAAGEQRDNRQLVAHVIPSGEADAGTLRKFIASKLPDYMVPRHFLQHDAFPLTSNGKVDLKALPVPGQDPDPAPNRSSELASADERAIAAIWSEVLPADTIGPEDNFFDLGGHSLLAMRIVARIREQLRVELSMRELFRSPTVAALAAKLAECPRVDDDGPLPRARPDTAGRYRTFPLTDVQHAYWLGRSDAFELGNVACHAYFELDLDKLCPGRFAAAWRILIERHDMLRAVVSADGRQRILETVPDLDITLDDQRGLDPATAAARLYATREELSHQVLPADRWPLFEVRLSHKHDGTWRIHLSIDLLLADTRSLQTLAGELTVLLAEPGAELEPIGISFRDYVQGVTEFERSSTYLRARDYWLNRLDELPGGPDLPLAQAPAAVSIPSFHRRQLELDREAWGHLRRRCSAAGLTPSIALLAAFTEILTLWSRTPRYTVNMTLFNRLPLHDDIDRVLGDFTSIDLLVVDHSRPATFLERARALQQQSWEDLDHRHFSGVRVLQELAKRRGASVIGSIPVVFTSALILDGDGDAPWRLPGELVYGITQTPQVWLDHQVLELDGRLRLSWDTVDELFPSGLLDDMFEAYGDLLRHLARPDSPWEDAHGPWRSERPLRYGKRLPDGRLELPEQPAGRTAPASPQIGAMAADAPPAGESAQLERRIADIWCTRLPVAEIGRHDNFFELGGDSIVAIQLIGQLRQAGLQVTPTEFFATQTVAGLAALARAVDVAADPRVAAVGDVPMTPILHWFLAFELDTPHAWNLETILELRAPITRRDLQTAAQQLLDHHDALRLRLRQEDGRWTLRNHGPGEAVSLIEEDLSALDADRQEAEIARLTVAAHQSLHFSDGPVVRFVLFRRGAIGRDRLLIVLNHLVGDGVSLRILIDDLEEACRQLDAGETPSLPPATTSYREWARRLSAWAENGRARRDLEGWLARLPERCPPLPVDHPDGANGESTTRRLTRSLDRDETAALTRIGSAGSETRVRDVLLAALVETVAAWTGEAGVLLDIASHGRSELFADLDLSRSVGWYSANQPAYFEGTGSPDATCRQVARAMASAPGHSQSFGVLRYLDPDLEIRQALAARPRPQLSFNHVGRMDSGARAGRRFEPKSVDVWFGPDNERLYLLNVGVTILDDVLDVTWYYSHELYERSTIEALADGFVGTVRALLAANAVLQEQGA
ncbi:MAG: amino acid adenylation domain-containing protein [Acidobacteriota bacterium]